MATFVLCTSFTEATTEQLKDPEYLSQFIGGAWVPPFIQKMEALGHQVESPKDLDQKRGDIFRVPTQEFNIIQEDQNGLGFNLINQGAIGAVLYCLESPMYVPEFYDQLETLKPHFSHLMTFHQGKHPKFPSFEKPRPSPIPWTFRRPMVMVASHKHYSSLLSRGRKKGEIPTLDKALEHQLHDKRYEVIEHFMNKGVMDLYGKGWPPEFAQPVSDKIEILRRYKFGIAFENVSMHGYVTEKLIDHLVAGTIPIYWGAPDVDGIIPPDLFIHADKYDSWEQLYDKLCYFNPGQANQMIRDAQYWLITPQGQEFTYDGFAQSMTDLCLDHLKQMELKRNESRHHLPSHI